MRWETVGEDGEVAWKCTGKAWTFRETAKCSNVLEVHVVSHIVIGSYRNPWFFLMEKRCRFDLRFGQVDDRRAKETEASILSVYSPAVLWVPLHASKKFCIYSDPSIREFTACNHFQKDVIHSCRGWHDFSSHLLTDFCLLDDGCILHMLDRPVWHF